MLIIINSCENAMNIKKRAPFFFRRIESKLLTWRFANIIADGGRMPRVNPCYFVATCIRAGKSERNSIDGRSRSHNRPRLTGESTT